MSEELMEFTDSSSSNQNHQHAAQQAGTFQPYHPDVLHILNQVYHAAQQVYATMPLPLHPNLKQIQDHIQQAVLQTAASQPPHLPPDVTHILNHIQLAVLQAAASQPLEIQQSAIYIQNQVQQTVQQIVGSIPTHASSNVPLVQNQGSQQAALQPPDAHNTHASSNVPVVQNQGSQQAALQPPDAHNTHASSNVPLVQNQGSQQAALQPPDAHNTHASLNVYSNVPHIQNQGSQQAALQPPDVRINPLSGDPSSTINEGNHQDSSSVPQVSTVITNQPQRTPGQTPTKPFGRTGSQQDIYTAKGDHGATSDDGATSDVTKMDDGEASGATSVATRSSTPADTPEVNISAEQTQPLLPTHTGQNDTSGGAEPSAPRDTAKVTIRVEWTRDIPDRWDKHLEKALQKWTSTALGKNCEVINLRLLDEPRYAEVEISPSEMFDVLKTLTGQSLTFRELRCKAPVHFLVDETKPVTEPQQSGSSVKEKKGPVPEVNMVFNVDRLPLKTQTELKRRFGQDQTGNMLSFSGNFDTVEKTHREVREIVGGSKSAMAAAAVRNDPDGAKIPHQAEKSGDPRALTAPLSHYWYFSHAFSKELLQLEKRFGVKVNAEVSVSVTAVNQDGSDSVQEATQTLTDLYQKNIHSLKSTEIPQTHLETELVKQVVQDVQSGKNKMMLNLSEDQCQLFGPERVISAVQKQMNLESPMEIDPSRMKFNGASSSSSSQTLRPLDMDIKDALDPIEMKEALWELIKKTSQEQIHNIETKYGVLLCPARSQDKVKVTVQSNSQHVNLESHALRAFMRLYQKVATSAVACTVKDSAEEKTVQALKSCEDCFVRVQEKNSPLKLVGLPKRLGPAITEIETLVGKSVFDKKTKQLIGYTEKLPQSWGLRGGAGVAEWTYRTYPDRETQAKNESGKAVKEKESDNDDCPICMDKFTDKRKLTCGHEFCRECLDGSVKAMGKVCPVCKDVFGTLTGTQPKGTMDISKQRSSLSGYPHCGTIEIFYHIPDGFQTERHPNPGKRFHGTSRRAYLPDNDEGRHVLKLLQKAFDQRLIFTVGTSTTTGASDSVIWNDIHHKTNPTGGPHSYGYPDPDYLKRVKEELKSKGIE